MPDDVPFASKTDLARAMLGRALDAGVPATWATADEAYGKDGSFRDWLEQRRLAYVVAVPKSQAVAGDAGKSRADALTADAPEQAWKRRSCGNGSKGPRVYDWAAATLPEDSTEPPGWQRFLLVRRSLTPNARGERELAYYLCAARQAPKTRSSSGSPGPAGPWRSASRRRRTRPASITIRSAATTPGTATLPSPSLAHAYLAVTAASAPKALAAASSRSRSQKSAVYWHT